MPVDVFVNFKGNCREAVEFYAQVFKTEPPKFMTFGDVPPNPDMHLPEEAKNLIMYTDLHITGSIVMFSDVLDNMPLTIGNNVSLTVGHKDPEEIKRMFNEMKVGGQVLMDLQETFWSKCYGCLTDKFGVGWQFSHYEGEPAK